MTADVAAEEYCVNEAGFCGDGRAKKQAREKEDRKEKEEEKKDMFKDLPPDSKLGLQRMLESARDDPLTYLDDDAKARVVQGRADLRCPVCRELFEDVHRQVAK